MLSTQHAVRRRAVLCDTTGRYRFTKIQSVCCNSPVILMGNMLGLAHGSSTTGNSLLYKMQMPRAPGMSLVFLDGEDLRALFR